MKLMDIERLIPSIESAMKISLGLMELIGLESTDDYYKGVESTYKSIIEAFKKQEEFVDAVPVVRCKDCKYARHDSEYLISENWYYCVRHEESHKPNWHCADGERKDGDSDGKAVSDGKAD